MRPMLAAFIADLDKLRYPLVGSPKLDGIRCLKDQGKLRSRNGLRLPNGYINRVLTPLIANGFDGELMVGQSFQACTSGIMSREGEPRFRFYLFDHARLPLMFYEQRLHWLKHWWKDHGDDELVRQYVRLVPTRMIPSPPPCVTSKK